MDVTAIPFNRFIGIQRADIPGRLLMLRETPDFANHLGTVHASAQFALAEATSGAFLLDRFKEQSATVAGVVRRCEVKFSKPAQGTLYASASLDGDHAQIVAQLDSKGRTVVRINVRVENATGDGTMAATIEWFLTALSQRTS